MPKINNDVLSPRKTSVDMASFKELVPSMNIAIPEEFICPLSGNVMVHPLMTRTGLNFEKSAIIEWIQTGDGNCPINGTALEPSDLIPNRALEEKIAFWRWDNMLPEPNETATGSRSFSSSSSLPDGSIDVIGIISPKKKKTETKFLKQFTYSIMKNNEEALSSK